MPEQVEAGATIGAPPILLRIGLFVTVALIGAAVVEPAAWSLAVGLHGLLRIYDGRFSGWRRLTWLLLVVGFFLFFAVGFARYVLPWGALAFWLTAHFGETAWLVVQLLTIPLLVSIGLFLVVLADTLAMHAGSFRGRGAWLTIVLLVVVAITPGVLSDVLRLTAAVQAPANVGSLPTPQHIMPAFDQLPLFAILRAVPSKEWGVALVAVVLLLPASAAWTRAWQLHSPQTRLIWTLATVAFAATWIGLGWIGWQPSQEAADVQWSVLALVAYQLAFYVVLPPVLSRYARRRDQRAVVFD